MAVKTTAINSTITQYNIISGGANNTFNNIGTSAGVGIPCCGNGASSQPTYLVMKVGGGGTGISSTTAYSLLCGGTGGGNPFQQINPVASGSILKSNGATLNLPSWSTSMPITSITLSSGTTLSAYNEGTWTPTVIGSGSNPTVTYTAQVGRYNRTGNSVLLTAQVILATKSGGSGNVGIGGLPYTTANVTNQEYVFATTTQNVTYDASTTCIQARTQANKATIPLFDEIISATTLADVSVANTGATASLWISGWISLA